MSVAMVERRVTGAQKKKEPFTGNLWRAWSYGEVEELRVLAAAGMGARAIAVLVDRSLLSVKKAAHRYRISLRKPGSRRGSILGQPRGTSFAKSTSPKLRAIRAGVVAGSLDPVKLEQMVIANVTRVEDLCPHCGVRLRGNRETGICAVCHLEELAGAHTEGQAVEKAQQGLWRERQRKVRRTERRG